MIKRLIFLGAPGVGKGTIAKLFETKMGMVHVSTGDIFRDNIKNQTAIGKQVAKILKLGSYVPDGLTNQILADRIKKHDTLTKGFVLDGFPRTLNQAKFLKDNNIRVDAVILLEAPKSIIHERLKTRAHAEKRNDDTPAVIAHRIAVYHQKTAPLINYYEAEKLLVRVDASGDVIANFNNILKELT